MTNQREVEIGEVCELINGRAFKPEEWEEDGLPIVRIQNLNNQTAPFNHYSKPVKDRYYIDDGELLFAWSGTPGTSFGAHIWRGGRAILNQHIYRVLVDPEEVDKHFFKYAINHKLNALIRKAHGGGGLQHVTKGKFESTAIQPPPLPQQRRIVQTLDELTARADGAEAHLSAIPPLVDKFKKSLLARAFSGELTREWRAEHPDVEPASELLERIRPERRKKWVHNYAANLADRAEKRADKKGEPFDQEDWQAYYDKKIPQGEDRYEEPEGVDPEEEDLPEIPETWEWVRFATLGELSRGKSRHRPRNDPKLFGGSFPFVQTGDIAAAKGKLLDATEYYNETGLQQSRLFPESTVCITIAANIADSAILGIPACFPDSVVGFISDDLTHVDPEFIEFFIRSIKYKLEYSAASATAQKNINLGILRQIAVPLPPIEEQNTIVESVRSEFQAISRAREQAGTSRAKLNQLRSSLLADLLG